MVESETDLDLPIMASLPKYSPKVAGALVHEIGYLKALKEMDWGPQEYGRKMIGIHIAKIFRGFLILGSALESLYILEVQEIPFPDA